METELFKEIMLNISNYVLKGNRSSVLKSLSVPFFLLVIALGLVLKYENQMAINIISIIFILAFGTFLGMFIYFGIKKPELLRSEEFQLKKEAQERKRLEGIKKQPIPFLDDKEIVSEDNKKRLEAK
jgi:hypothetical protein